MSARCARATGTRWADPSKPKRRAALPRLCSKPTAHGRAPGVLQPAALPPRRGPAAQRVTGITCLCTALLRLNLSPYTGLLGAWSTRAGPGIPSGRIPAPAGAAPSALTHQVSGKPLLRARRSGQPMRRTRLSLQGLRFPPQEPAAPCKTNHKTAPLCTPRGAPNPCPQAHCCHCA